MRVYKSFYIFMNYFQTGGAPSLPSTGTMHLLIQTEELEAYKIKN